MPNENLTPEQVADMLRAPKTLPPPANILVQDLCVRTFPHISDEDKVNFVHRTNEMSGIPLQKSEIADYFLVDKRANPAISGQVAALRLVLHFATRNDLIPNESTTASNLDRQFPWFRKINLNVLGDYVDSGTLYLYNRAEQSLDDIQSYRNYDILTVVGIAPYPLRIRQLLADAFNRYRTVYDRYRNHFDNPRMFERDDYEDLEMAARTFNLDICAIKPFLDGSNRVGRLAENLLRLHVGLPFLTFVGIDTHETVVRLYRKRYRCHAPASMPASAPDRKITL